MDELPLDKFYEKMEWNVIPDDICEMIFEYLKTSVEPIRDNYPWQAAGHGQFQMHDAPDFLWEWCQENIPLNFNEYCVSVQMIPTHHCRTHVDTGLRNSSFNFVLTDDQAVTSWYDETKENILHSVQYKAKTWYHHQGAVFHRITGVLTPPRVAVTIYKII